MAAAAAQSPEARELSLIEKVEFRIALADTDAKLQSILGTYLTPLLLKLSSEHVAVRNKVISVCQHVNKRVIPENIQLPVAALLKQFRENPQTQLIRHFDLVYAQQGLPRLTPADRAALVPDLIPGIAAIASVSAPHAATSFNILLRCLTERPLPPRGSPEDERLRADLKINDDDAAFLSKWIGKLLLFKQSPSQSNSALSSEELDFLTLQQKPEVWDPSARAGLNLTQTKVIVLKLISSGAFTDQERMLPGLFASADPNSRISETGDGLVKQAIARIEIDDHGLIKSLYEFYDRAGSMLSVRIKILGVLSKSRLSTNYAPQIIRLVEQGLVESTTRVDRELTKLRAGIIHFLGFAARNADRQTISDIARNVIERLKDFLEQQHADAHSLEMRNLRGKCFEVVGSLASVDTGLVLEADLSLLRWLFRALAEESDKEVVFSIDDAISSVLKPFEQNTDGHIQSALKDLLVDVLGLDSANPRNTRFACLRFANRCLPFSDATARWIDISASGSDEGQSHEISEEARKGMDPYWHKMQATNSADSAAAEAGLSAPDFVELVTIVMKRNSDALSNEVRLQTAVSFCRRCLFWTCLYPSGSSVSTDADWERKMDLALSSDPETRATIRSALKSAATNESLQDCILSLFDASMRGLRSASKAIPEFGSLIVELASLCPDSTVQQFIPSIKDLCSAAMVNDPETRRLAAQALGVLASHPHVSGATLDNVSTTLLAAASQWKTSIGAQLNKAHGALLALGHVISRLRLRGKHVSERASGLLSIAIDIVNESTDSMLLSGSYASLGQVFLFRAVDKDALSKHKGVDSLVQKASKDAKAGNEKAMSFLGLSSMALDEHQDEGLLSRLLDDICALHEIRQAETQFTVGESLACLAFGWDSSALFPNLDIEGQSPTPVLREKLAVAAIEKVLQDCKTTKPSLKKASVIWLLCLLQFGETRKEVLERLPQFQAAFKRCLSDRDELVQESSSRGLGLVYEKGDRDLKDSLVRDLVSSFTGDKAETSGTVTEDTQLFEPGALPTGDGSITTYKDIMSLASEVGDSSLVYRFMSLASHNAIWSSRAAFGRFGLSNVLSDSSVDGYLATNPKLYPKLYRYRFDPNTNVRRSMNDIWLALVKDPAKTIDTHFGAIMDDLLISMVGREWRARQASCAAVADLVQGRPLPQLQPYTDRIWTLCFKVLDDIKDSVRKAAGELARVLTGILLRNLEGSEGKEEALGQLLKSVFSFLLSTSGLESSAKEVQGFSLHTLLEVIKKGRPRDLRPFVPDLVSQLVGFLSTFEPEAVNYVALNASNYNLQQSDIDDMRLKSIRSSPLMEAIERCLDMLDESTMAALVPKLQEALKVSVGVPSKVGLSRVMVSLSTRCNFVFKPHADGQLAAIQRRLLDRNETVSSSYAAAIGYVARLASNAQLLKTITSTKQLYFGDEATDQTRFVAGEVMQALARHATDRYNSVSSEAFPFVFFGRFDADQRAKDVFKETYNETVSGPRAVALHFEEVVALAQAQLGSNKWTLKHSGALAIAEAVQAVAASHGSLTERQCTVAWPGLRTALAEKSWEGKEDVLTGLTVFAGKGDKSVTHKDEMRTEMLKIAVREAKRRSSLYQAAALANLGKITAALRPDDENLDAVADIAQGVVDEESHMDSKPAEKATDKAEKGSSTLRGGRLSGAVDALFDVLRARLEHGAEHRVAHGTSGKDTPPASSSTSFADPSGAAAAAAHELREPLAAPLEARAAQALRLAGRALAAAASLESPVSTQVRVLAQLKETWLVLGRHPRFLTAASPLPALTVEPLTADPHSVAQERARILRSEALSALVNAISAAGVTPPIPLAPAVASLLADEKSVSVRGGLARIHEQLMRSS